MKGISEWHEPVAKGKCLDCHTVHSSGTEGLLKKPPSQLCFLCHPEHRQKLASEKSHAPAGKGNCLGCHEEHSSQFEFLLKRNERELCLSCHGKTPEALKAAHSGFPVQDGGCTTCHDPHSTPPGVKALLYPQQHEPFSQGNCDLCHVKGSLETKEKGSALCFMCHSDYGSTFDKAFVHTPVATGKECVSCHLPHAAHGKDLLRRESDKICFLCHTESDFNKKFKHEPAEDCRSCHNSHASDFENLLPTESIELCNQCHETQGSFTHPVGGDLKDPRTGETLTCSSCHDPHSADHDGLLSYDRQKELCQQCHTRL
jgi:predicted CXXCH cytochrome family protein